MKNPRQWFLLSTICSLFLFSHNGYADEKTVDLISRDNEVVSFPRSISPIGNHLERSKWIDGSDLSSLKHAVDRLREAARDNNGQAVQPEQFSSETIFVQSLVIQILSEQFEAVAQSDLVKLYQGAKLLGIRPLERGFAYLVVKNSTNLPDEIQDDLVIKEMKETIKTNVIPFSISDWIGIHGQPNIGPGILDLSNKMLTQVEGIERIARKQEIRRLNVSGNRILGEFLSSMPFVSLPMLESLEIENNHLTAFPKTGLNGLSRLSTVNFNNNNLSEVPEGLLNESSALRYISFRSNKIHSIHPNAFKGLNNLQSLYLDHNELTHVPSMLLDDLIQLETLDLSHNRLVDLPNQFVDHLTSLKLFHVNNNQLQGLPKRFFSNISPSFVDATSNQFRWTKTKFRRHTQLRDAPLNYDKHNKRFFCF